MSALARTPFMPPLNSLWMLTRDVPVTEALLNRYDNDTLQQSAGLVSLNDWLNREGNRNSEGWVPRWHEFNKEQLERLAPTLPAGTIISFNRYHASNSGDVAITLQFYRSPDPRFTPKKRGGKGKGAMRFYVNLDEFNSLGEMEPFDGSTP